MGNIHLGTGKVLERNCQETTKRPGEQRKNRGGKHSFGDRKGTRKKLSGNDKKTQRKNRGGKHSFGDRKGTRKKLCDKDLAERSGELSGALWAQLAPFRPTHSHSPPADGALS